jgi:hypothetical protein
MNRSFAIVSLAAFALSAPAFEASAQDLTITFKSSDGGTSSNYYTKDRIRTSSGRTDTILEFATGKIISVDHQKKEYSEITFAEMDSMMKAQTERMEQAMANVPANMREQMQKMMGGGTADVTVTKGGTKTIAGYSCQEYTVTMGPNLTTELCNTTALTPPFDPANASKLSRVSVPMMKGSEKVAQKLAEVQGLSLSHRTSTNVMGHKSDSSMEATEVKKGSIPADVFAIPAGYKQVESPMKAMGRMGGK